MRTLLITDVITRQAQIVSAVDAARILNLHNEEFEVALEERGIYEGERYTVSEIVVLHAG